MGFRPKEVRPCHASALARLRAVGHAITMLIATQTPIGMPKATSIARTRIARTSLSITGFVREKAEEGPAYALAAEGSKVVITKAAQATRGIAQGKIGVMALTIALQAIKRADVGA